ncbi:Pathogenicity island protein [Bacillus sonorensis]|uniref:Pathogenicity island protein n=1 Tax=Bacillus sonorensis TaxID=119858 RepID=UPI001ECD912D|nr:Pathogenicity island protein [Bacillus sonorensis]MBS4161244.1 Pathogenicity island protein [Klebsiella pneumoniae]MDR4956966.1 Pathogenicity island protein [Bacillus sonorensis]
MKKQIVLIVSFALLLTLFMNATAAAQAEESKRVGTIEKINDSELKLTLDHAEAMINSKGEAAIIDSVTGERETLPTSTVDKHHHPVDLDYEKTGNGLLVKVIKKNSGNMFHTQSVAKCILGTSGGAVTGAGTGGLAGAAVGTVTIPVVGTVSAGLVGTIVGGVGGGLTGAAASCF